MAAGSSSTENQVAIIQERIDCLHELSTDLTASNGAVIHDKMMFFIGDHPAQQFERGTQQSGKFKCGGCGVRDTLLGDLAHTLQHSWRSIHDLQSIATGWQTREECRQYRQSKSRTNQAGATWGNMTRTKKKGNSAKPT